MGLLAKMGFDERYIQSSISQLEYIFILYNMHTQLCRVMFCKVRGFRVTVWESYRTSRSFGYGYGSVPELPELLGIVALPYRTHRISGRIQNVLYQYPGYCGTGLPELT